MLTIENAHSKKSNEIYTSFMELQLKKTKTKTTTKKTNNRRNNNKTPKFILLHDEVWIQINALALWMNSRLEKNHKCRKGSLKRVGIVTFSLEIKNWVKILCFVLIYPTTRCNKNRMEPFSKVQWWDRRQQETTRHDAVSRKLDYLTFCNLHFCGILFWTKLLFSIQWKQNQKNPSTD